MHIVDSIMRHLGKQYVLLTQMWTKDKVKLVIRDTEDNSFYSISITQSSVIPIN